MFDDELAHLAKNWRRESARSSSDRITSRRFYVPPAARWQSPNASPKVGENMTDALLAVAKQNPDLSGVIDITDSPRPRRVADRDNGRLATLVQVLSNPCVPPRPDDVEPDISAAVRVPPAEVRGEPGAISRRVLHPVGRRDRHGSNSRPEAGRNGLRPVLRVRQVAHQVPPLADANTRQTGERPRAAAEEGRAAKGVRPGDQRSAFTMARMNDFLHDMETYFRIGDNMRIQEFTDAGGKRFGQFVVFAGNQLNGAR